MTTPQAELPAFEHQNSAPSERPDLDFKRVLKPMLAVLLVTAAFLQVLPMIMGVGWSWPALIFTITTFTVASVLLRHRLFDDRPPVDRVMNAAGMLWVSATVAELIFVGVQVSLAGIVQSLVMGSILALFTGLLLLPVFVAWTRGSQHKTAILLLVILAGWTVVGWIAAFIWAVIDPIATDDSGGQIRSAGEAVNSTPDESADALRSLNALSDLADRGAISQEQLEAKRQELLDRI